MAYTIRMAGAIGIAAVALGLTDRLAAQDLRHDTARPQITVSGEGVVQVTPDIVRLHAGVTTAAKTAREAGETNARVMTAVMVAIKAANIPDKDIKTERYVIEPVYGSSYVSGPANQITGFRATNTVVLTLHNPDGLSDLIDRVTAAGANTLRGIEYTVSDRSKVLDEARAAAVADAQRKAELYARAAGVTLGRPIAIVEGSANTFEPTPLLRGRGAVISQTPVAPGETTLQVSIKASFELQH